MGGPYQGLACQRARPHPSLSHGWKCELYFRAISAAWLTSRSLWGVHRLRRAVEHPMPIVQIEAILRDLLNPLIFWIGVPRNPPIVPD